MLGVGGSISSVVENKYNISLNGTSDYINIDSFTQHADLANGMAWSLAVWFKGNGSATSGAHTNMLFSAHDSNADNRLRIGIDADGSKGVYYSDAQATQADIGGVDLDDGNWHLVVISRPYGVDQQITVYIDGATAGTVANTEVLWDNDLTFASIGQEYDPASPAAASDFFGGEIAQLAFWKAELLRDDVSSIYSAGRNADLNAPRPSYQNHDKIIGYWKMGDGSFDDKVNGVVHNQANPGFGSELVLNGDFEELGDEEVVDGNFPSGTTAWTSDASTVFAEGSVTLTGVGSYKNLLVQTNVLESDKLYKVTYTCDLSSVISGSLKLQSFSDGSVSRTVLDGTNTIYLTANATTFYFGEGGMSGTATLSNVSVQQVDPNNRWTLSSQGDSTSIITDKLTLTCDDGDNVSAAQYYSFTDGNTYKLSFDLTGDNQNKNITIRDNSGATGGLSENVSLNFTGTETKTFIFTANSDSNSIYTKRVSSGTYSWSIDNVSVKKLNDGSGLVAGATFAADN